VLACLCVAKDAVLISMWKCVGTGQWFEEPPCLAVITEIAVVESPPIRCHKSNTNSRRFYISLRPILIQHNKSLILQRQNKRYRLKHLWKLTWLWKLGWIFRPSQVFESRPLKPHGNRVKSRRGQKKDNLFKLVFETVLKVDTEFDECISGYWIVLLNWCLIDDDELWDWVWVPWFSRRSQLDGLLLHWGKQRDHHWKELLSNEFVGLAIHQRDILTVSN
jgi:hypothetical protein